jgi:hypothetical protein
VPALFEGLVDDAAVFPPGNAPLDRAVVAHHRHRAAWYAGLVGPFVVPASSAADLIGLLTTDPTTTDPVTTDPVTTDPLATVIVGDTGMARIAEAANTLRDAGIPVRQIEVAVAKRGEDPQPGLAQLIEVTAGLEGVGGFAEIPLTWGVLGALDTIADARRGGASVSAKFRTGGLAAELFPSPSDLAAVIVACHERGVPFKLTAGLHRAVRHNNPETGFTHHGFLNILVACLLAAEGESPATVGERLAASDPVPLIEVVRAARDEPRPLWTGFGSCDISEPVDDLVAFGLLG